MIKRFDIFVISLIFIYTLAAIVVSLNRYWQYQNFYFDFGIFDSAIWKVSQFSLPYVDHVDFGSKNILIFGDHFNPSIFLLAPLYWITSRSEVLLIAQSLAVGLGGLVAFFISKKFLKNKLSQLALVTAFLGYVGLQNALISDFHEATVAVLPLTLLFWAIFNKRWKLYFLFLIIVLGFKESFAGLGIGVGLYLLLQDRRNFKFGLLTIFISLIWGITTILFIIPLFSHGVYLYTPQQFPPDIQHFIASFLSPASRWNTIFYTYLTFGFLPLFDIAVLPAVFENFFERFILSSSKGQDLGMHYNAPLAPLMFMGALKVFILMEKNRVLSKWVGFCSVAIILTVFVLHRFILHGPLGLIYNPVFFEQNQNVKYMDNFAANFPKGGLIMTQNNLAARLAHQDVKLLRKNYSLINPDYIILNLTPGQNPNSFFPLSYQEVLDIKERLLQDEMYKAVKFGSELYIFQRSLLR